MAADDIIFGGGHRVCVGPSKTFCCGSGFVVIKRGRGASDRGERLESVERAERERRRSMSIERPFGAFRPLPVELRPSLPRVPRVRGLEEEEEKEVEEQEDHIDSEVDGCETSRRRLACRWAGYRFKRRGSLVFHFGGPCAIGGTLISWHLPPVHLISSNLPT